MRNLGSLLGWIGRHRVSRSVRRFWTLTVARQHEAALAGGDDYELIFTAPPAAAERIFEAGLLSNTPVSRIGRILEREETAVVVRTADGLPVAVPSTGYDHFNAEDPE